jgi:hypothetical protein
MRDMEDGSPPSQSVGAKVAFFSLEMSADQLATRILAEQSGISSESLRMGRISREDFDKAADFYRSRTGTTVTPIDARKRVKRVMEEQGLEPRRSGWLFKTRRWYRQIGE